MATILRRVVAVTIWTPPVICTRTMKSVNTRMKKPMHILRAKLMAVTERKARPDPRSMAEQCSMRESVRKPAIVEPNLSQAFYSKICRKVFESSQMIAVFHHDGITNEEKSEMTRRLRKHNISFKVYGYSIVMEAIEGTKFENMKPLFDGPCIIAVSEIPSVKELIKATRKLPKVHLLGGFVTDRLLSPKGMEHYSNLPTLDVARGQLAGLLTSSISRTSSLLQANQQRLTMNLDQLVKKGGESKEEMAEDR